MAADETSESDGGDLLAPLQQDLNAAPRDKPARLELEFLSGTEPEWMPALLLRRDLEISEQLAEHVKVMGGAPGKYRLRLKVGGKVARTATMRLTFAVAPQVAPAVAPQVAPPVTLGGETAPRSLKEQLRHFKEEQREIAEVVEALAPTPAPEPTPPPVEEEEEEEDDEDEEDDDAPRGFWAKLADRFADKLFEGDGAGEVVASVAVKVNELLDAKIEAATLRNKLNAVRVARASTLGHAGGNGATGPTVVGVERVEEPQQ